MKSEVCLDLSRLENLRQRGDSLIARCPACAEEGGDHRSIHLRIFPSGKFCCAARQKDVEHNRLIFALIGLPNERKPSDPAEVRRWKEQRAKEQRRVQERARLSAIIREKRSTIIARHSWTERDAWDDSPQRIDSDMVENDPRYFIVSLFSPDSLVWTGDVFHSGPRYANRWRTSAKWQGAEIIGPMTTPAIWKPGTENRSAEQVLSSPFTVLDFDGFDGKKPETPAELERHREDSLALIRWISTGLRWQLAAIVWTGSKSMHAWFHTPAPAVLESLREASSDLGIDAGLIGRPEHPCRLPGQRHKKTGQASRVLWLQTRGE
jgi:hypothetical protein